MDEKTAWRILLAACALFCAFSWSMWLRDRVLQNNNLSRPGWERYADPD